MTRHKTVTLVLAFLLSISNVNLIPVQQARADGYSNGFVSAGGYTWRDGYWWLNGRAYTRHKVQEAYTYYRGRCAYTGYRWVWRYTPTVTKRVVITKQDLSEDGWRGKLLELAKQRDSYEGQLRKSAVEHNEFLESLRILGLEGNFKWNGYGYEMQYAQGGHVYGQQSQYSQPPAAQGSTIYGYREMADIYGNVDLGALFNQAMRLRQQSYGNESKATSETHALMGQLAADMRAIKEIEAKGRAAAAALQAAGAKDRATLLREFWQSGGSTTPSGGTQGSTAPVNRNEALTAMTAVVKTKCAACHNSEKKNGGLDLSDLTALSADQGKKILERIVHSDETKRMPLGPDLKPGTPLTQAEIAAFFLAAYGPAPQQPAKKD